jgi:UDP-N-acetylmuramate--alanine ligase
MSEQAGTVHLVGIGGIHMSAIGQLLLERGARVSGSDLRPSDLTRRLEELGARVFVGHEAANVGPDVALVVTTAAAGEDNLELAEARRRGIPVILRAEMVARLMEGKRVVAVAGSAGKTTTASMVAFILARAGLEPMYLLGGESIDLGGHAAWGAGDLCVVEADEYRRAFLEYRPALAVITNVQPDHLDYFGSAEAYHEAFLAFARRVVPGGTLVACADDTGSAEVARQVEGVCVETYGIESQATWTAASLRLSEREARFAVRRENDHRGELTVHVPGRYFVLNALAATAACLDLGVPFETVRACLDEFRGAHRRFELIGEARGVTVMDDYAHHPAKVRALIEAARARFPGRQLVGVYQPHTYTRIAYLWDDWLTCFRGLDDLVVLETYAAREEPRPGFTAADLARAIEDPEASYAADFDDAAQQAVALARPGAVIFTIGAGDVDEVAPRVLERLR